MDSRFHAIKKQIQDASLLVVLGPTASGKTRFAIALAQQVNGEIISADSRQVYQKMDIGTGKDLHEYRQANVKYHLIDLIPAGTKYNLHQFQLDYSIALETIKASHKKPILCGGSGLYLEAALAPKLYTQIAENPKLRAQFQALSLQELQAIYLQQQVNLPQHQPDLSTKKRAIRALEIAYFLNENPSFIFEPRKVEKPLIIGIEPQLAQRRKNIETRLNQRLQNGMIEEVESLLLSGIEKDDLIYYGLEYKFITLYLSGQLSYIQMQQQLLIAIQQFAKRQMTYFRKMEKDGFQIHWFKPEEINTILTNAF